MENIKWKHLFAQKILERGYNYYQEGEVINLELENQNIIADVTGSERYSVEIEICGGEVTDMLCTCPYADDGFYCKHMAATLYAWENSPKPIKTKNVKIEKTSVEQMVNELTEETAKKLLIEFAKRSKEKGRLNLP